MTFSIKPNKMKKVLIFLVLRAIDGSDKAFIISTYILYKLILSKSLSKNDFIFSKFVIYQVVFLSKYWFTCFFNLFFNLSQSWLICLNN